MHEFWYDYLKLKYGEKTKLCYINTHTFIVYIITYGIYVDNAKDVETRFDTLNSELERPLHGGKKKILVELM